ncbi:DNA cytosine methyltransferase [Peribacillus sp. Bi134]|uniref:DNA cytosine methyltransferase n=1 Tax=Peribacillus sp. Bi134 TaxID=2884272 RepID=UPI001D955C33|nr:DNA cytosine methyltransferase [Peribacillus sp. Bi134]CAH0298487.1 putative BsuMI modification methylase subunit YdiO [Peribacillus sp. Bi134]
MIEQLSIFNNIDTNIDTSEQEIIDLKMREVSGNDYNFLRKKENEPLPRSNRVINVVDLFSGCGGLSLGIKEACRTLGYGFRVPLAIDFDKNAYECYKHNFKESFAVNADIGELMSSELGSKVTEREKLLINQIGKVDFLVGGPPCQGHSDLNNSTRRNDPKNGLYLYMARAAELFSPTHIIIENVVGAIHDKNRVVQTVADYLSQLGYNVNMGIINLAKIGVPQSRKRLVLIASKVASLDINVESIEKRYSLDERNIKWAFEDLMGIKSNSIVDKVSTPSKDNRRRIDYLFENNLYELPNEERPPCHRDKKHSYKSIYGRLNWDNPSQTITSGFYSMCMGRYVHPSDRRTLTAHEAARVQFFPDFFDFSPIKTRSALATIIGNAVPMKLSYIISLELLKK